MAKTLGTQFGYIFGCLELRVRDRNLTKNEYEHDPGTEDISYASTIVHAQLKEEHNIGLHFSYFFSAAILDFSMEREDNVNWRIFHRPDMHVCYAS